MAHEASARRSTHELAAVGDELVATRAALAAETAAVETAAGSKGWVAEVIHGYNPGVGEQDRLAVAAGELLLVPHPAACTSEWVFGQAVALAGGDRLANARCSQTDPQAAWRRGLPGRQGWVPRNHVRLRPPPSSLGSRLGPGAE